MQSQDQSSSPSTSFSNFFLVFIRLIGGIVVVGMILFLPAGTFSYWQAWVYLGVLFIPMILFAAYMLKKKPSLLKRRLRMNEKENQQKLVIVLSSVIILIIFILPGFDQRFNWSTVPIWLVLVAVLGVLGGYILYALTIITNDFAARTVDVEDEQKVISNGVYGVVRHPMYVAMIFIFIFTPLALGSFWAIIPALIFPFILMARIKNEEKLLKNELPGYEEYCRKVQYRLLPGVW